MAVLHWRNCKVPAVRQQILDLIMPRGLLTSSTASPVVEYTRDAHPLAPVASGSHRHIDTTICQRGLNVRDLPGQDGIFQASEARVA